MSKIIEYENRICIVCGATFKVNVKASNKTCSHECSKRYRSRKDTQKKDKRIRGKDFISLELLYKRDRGICYLCGLECNYHDYKIIDGYFVTGPMYPTVDHTVPLSRGGKHSWDNVRLAHFKCNYVKGEATGRNIISVEERKKNARERCKNKKEVIMYNNGMEYMRFESTASAARYFDFKDKSIQNACRGEGTGGKGSHKMYGFEWYYA